MNFGVCTPSPLNVLNLLGSNAVQPFQRSDPQIPVTSSAHGNTPVIATALEHIDMSGRHLYDRDNTEEPYLISGGVGNPEHPVGKLRGDHGSVDDIEHYFMSADDWDRSRFDDQQTGNCDDDYEFGTSSSGLANPTIVCDINANKEMFPFLSTPTPTSPALRYISASYNQLPIERTSSLPLPSAQVDYFCTTRVSDGTLGCLFVGVSTNVNSCDVRSDEEYADNSIPSTTPARIFAGLQRDPIALQDYSSACAPHRQPILQSSQPNCDYKTVSLKKLQRGRPSRYQYRTLDSDQDVEQDIGAGSKGRIKRGRNSLQDILAGDIVTSSHVDYNIGPLEGFLSSNILIGDGLNEQTGPFFLQQSMNYHPKALTLKELYEGASSSVGASVLGSLGLGLPGVSKKRYRKHPASISARKAKLEAQYESVAQGQRVKEQPALTADGGDSNIARGYEGDKVTLHCLTYS